MSGKNKLTALAVSRLTAGEKDKLISDGGALFISVRAESLGGKQSFRMAYRVAGKQKWLTLKATTLKEARIERDNYQEMISRGLDPAIERKLQIERNRLAQLEELAGRPKLLTVSDLFDRWAATDLIRRNDGGKEACRAFKKDVIPYIGGLPVVEVRKSHVADIVDRLLQRGVNRTAKVVLGLMRQMFKYAVERDIIETDPSLGIKKSRVGGPEVERDRVLSKDELHLLAKLLPEAGLMWTMEHAVYILLGTCCRSGEIAKAKWADIDFERGEWLIPASHSKNGRAHRVYLSDFCLDRFKELYEYRISDWVLESDGNCLGKFAIAQQLARRQSERNGGLSLPGGRWTAHDLRRTGATLLCELGVLPGVIEKMLNHTEANQLRRVYQRHEYVAEQKAAWDLLGRRCGEIFTDIEVL